MNEHEHIGKDEPATTPTQDEVARNVYALYLKKSRLQENAEQNWLEERPSGADVGEHGDRGHQCATAETGEMTKWLENGTRIAMNTTQR
ncbi:MAG: hypothetical protein R3B37_16790 [Nitrospira sp.]|nr:hypothetical protein [Nitrospira sp.]